MLAELRSRVPDGHRAFVAGLLDRFAVPPIPSDVRPLEVFPLGPSAAAARLNIASALDHGARLIVSALGAPPKDAVDDAHARGVLVGGMVGSPAHVDAHLVAGVDLLIAQGAEAAAHAGDISTMVLVPEVADLVHPLPVLAAGGIATGRQFLAARALGAQGVWTGSMWRIASENDESAGIIARLLAAGSADTVRSRCMTGKPLRQLRTAWTDAWTGADAPEPLPMPLQRILTTEAEQRVDYHRRDDLAVSPIGQVVGQLREVKPAADLLRDMVEEYQSLLAPDATIHHDRRPVA
jgi:NAD(P)H-dependent flavin oxidoreductase YrpB (nitropropane dioxygenase family)